VSDVVLQEWLRDSGHVGRCSFCAKRRIACPIRQVAEKIDTVIREFYRPGELRGHVVEESDNLQYWQDGEPATYIIQEIAGIEPAIADAIDAYLRAAEFHDVRDGDEAYYGGVPLEHINAYPDEFMEIWLRFEERLTYEVRFFDEESKRLLDELFADLSSLGGGKAIATLEPGGEFSTFYRARIANGMSDVKAFLQDPGQNIGPPPPHLTRAGRMNPAGIPVFYGAFSENVAIAEVRPPVGAMVAVGGFSLLRSIRLLDVSFLPFAYHEESIFSPAYDHLRNKVRFLEKLHRRISQPVLPSDEALAYLPTQAFAAYVANVMGLDGMIYGSTQIGAEGEGAEQVDRSLCNIALFGEVARVEGVHPKPGPTDDPFPPCLLPDLGLPFGETSVDPERATAAEDEHIATAPAAASQEAIADLPDMAPVETPLHSGGTETGAKLRANPEPKLVRIRSVTVESSSMYTKLNEDGSLWITDYEEDDD